MFVESLEGGLKPLGVIADKQCGYVVLSILHGVDCIDGDKSIPVDVW